ncbi:hypothetical protein BDZ97DRAFT_2078674 [Flammula alnicola]|nr:hypothetical protein BDZ97DRAFT_2078674 [Flammula alnicola]
MATTAQGVTETEQAAGPSNSRPDEPSHLTAVKAAANAQYQPLRQTSKTLLRIVSVFQVAKIKGNNEKLIHETGHLISRLWGLYQESPDRGIWPPPALKGVIMNMETTVMAMASDLIEDKAGVSMAPRFHSLADLNKVKKYREDVERLSTNLSAYLEKAVTVTQVTESRNPPILPSDIPYAFPMQPVAAYGEILFNSSSFEQFGSGEVLRMGDDNEIGGPVDISNNNNIKYLP